MKDLFGKALLDFQNGNYSEDIVTSTNISDEDVLPLPYLFRKFKDMPKLEQKALKLCKGSVLDVGCGTGYSSAVMSRFASLVIALEENDDLAAFAAKTLEALDYDNVAVVKGKLNEGYASEGPYDIVFVNGAVETIPSALFEQVKDGGKLIVVEGQGNSAIARQYDRRGDDISGRNLFNCAVKPLPGFERKAEFVL